MVLGATAVAPFTTPLYRTEQDMRDIRDPQALGNTLLNRDPDTKVLEAADHLEQAVMPNYGETPHQYATRILRMSVNGNGTDED